MTWRKAFGVAGPSVAVVNTSRLQRKLFAATLFVDGVLWDVFVADSPKDAQAAAEHVVGTMDVVAASDVQVSRVRCGRAQGPYLAHVDEAVLMTDDDIAALQGKRFPADLTEHAKAKGWNTGYRRVIEAWAADPTTDWTQLSADLASQHAAPTPFVPPRW
jgi:hypothetical protein